MMNATKETTMHTPGPWTFEASPDRRRFFIWGNRQVMGNSWREAVAKTRSTTGDSDVEEANARLIAAAPAMELMLKLLSYGLARFEISPTTPLCEFCFDGLRYVWSGDYNGTMDVIGREKAQAAIAKAEGR